MTWFKLISTLALIAFFPCVSTTIQCPDMFFFDAMTRSCESCGIICGANGFSRVEQCLLEPTCRVDGKWDCANITSCDADCNSPYVDPAHPSLGRQGVAECICTFREDLGGIPCEGKKLTNCTVQIEDACKRKAEGALNIIIGATIGSLALLFVTILISCKKCKKCKNCSAASRDHFRVPVEETGDEPNAVRRVHDPVSDSAQDGIP